MLLSSFTESVRVVVQACAATSTNTLFVQGKAKAQEFFNKSRFCYTQRDLPYWSDSHLRLCVPHAKTSLKYGSLSLDNEFLQPVGPGTGFLAGDPGAWWIFCWVLCGVPVVVARYCYFLLGEVAFCGCHGFWVRLLKQQTTKKTPLYRKHKTPQASDFSPNATLFSTLWAVPHRALPADSS